MFANLWSSLQRRPWVPESSRSEDTLHRTKLSLGERLQREFQRETQGRIAKPRDLLLAEGGADTDRTVEAEV